MNTRELAERYPEAFQYLPTPYRNDDCLFFWELDRQLFCMPAKGQEPILGQWICRFDPDSKRWDFIAAGEEVKELRAKMLTVEELRGLLTSQLEEDLPEQVLSVFRDHAGKKLTKHLLKHLPAVDGKQGEEAWRISHHIGMTHLETWSYVRSQGNTGYHFLMAYSEKNVEIDPQDLCYHNPAYFSAREERNAERQATLSNPALLDKMTYAINAVREARAILQAAEQRFSDIEGFSADGYVWKKLTEE